MMTAQLARMTALATVLGMLGGVATAFAVPVGELTQQTHIHGLAVDPADGEQLLIATHHGLYRAGRDGDAQLVSPKQDFMGFTVHPNDPDTLYASGHPESGGNLGFIASTDGGRTWGQLSPGAEGPVDFHQLAVSQADPRTIYGHFRGLQVSRDGGETWAIVGPAPEKLIDLAASARNVDLLYAATETGLFVSADGGRTWCALLAGAPATLVEATTAGDLYAFIYGQGLMKAQEGSDDFVLLGYEAPGGFLLHLTVHPSDSQLLFAADKQGRVVTSIDGGRNWGLFGG